MIKIENVNKRFYSGTDNEVFALNNINLSVADGEFITIIGTNGSGKSSLLNAIAGSFYPDTGRITIDNKDFTYVPEYKRAKYISRVFQNPFIGTAADMTIGENLHLAFLRGSKRTLLLKLNKERKDFYITKLKELEMNLEDRIDSPIGTLSGGQRQAITLLMAVMQKPKVLLLDEHTAALDPKSAMQVLRLTKMFISKEKLTTIMVTHSMNQALELGNRTIMMNKGQIIEDINLKEKNSLTSEDLNNKFNQIRKIEKLTSRMIEDFRNQYV